MFSISANYSPVANDPSFEESQQRFQATVPKNEQSTAQSQKAAVELLAAEWKEIDKVKAENINNEFDDPIADDVLDTVFESNTILQSQKAWKTLYNINGNIITFSNKKEFQLEDMIDDTDGEYKITAIKDNTDFIKISHATDLNLFSTDQLYKLFVSIAPSLDIDPHRISKSFFIDNNEEAQNLLKVLRIFTDCIGLLPISMNGRWDASYLAFGDDECAYIRNRYSDSTYILVPFWK